MSAKPVNYTICVKPVGQFYILSLFYLHAAALLRVGDYANILDIQTQLVVSRLIFHKEVMASDQR